jgi:hypothetical protein
MMDQNFKICTKCNKSLLLENFSMRISAKQIRRSECRQCSAKRYEQWEYKNTEHKKEYYEKNKKIISLKNKTWKEKNLDRVKKQRKERDMKNKEKLQSQRKAYRTKYAQQEKNYALKRKFGISLEEYNLMFEKQKGACAICNRPERVMCEGKIKNLCIDHNHDTGKVRQLLCNSCNTAIGFFDENIHFLDSAIKYLIIHNEQKCHFIN